MVRTQLDWANFEHKDGINYETRSKNRFLDAGDSDDFHSHRFRLLC